MSLEQKIREFQISFLNLWPAMNYYFLRGWILRFTKGVTDRANSVLPYDYFGTEKTLLEDLHHVEKVYKDQTLPSLFTIPKFYKPLNLPEFLKKYGYESFSHSITMCADFDELNLSKLPSLDINCIIKSNLFNEFSEIHINNTEKTRRTEKIIYDLFKRFNNIKKGFIVVTIGKKPIATIMGTLDHNGYLYMGDLFVLPSYRNHGLAKAIILELIRWATPKGAKEIYLQVEKKNEVALSLYKQLGFKKLYEYYYLKKKM
jgi:GNAT superfamily N-acetyltransferase